MCVCVCPIIFLFMHSRRVRVLQCMTAGRRRRSLQSVNNVTVRIVTMSLQQSVGYTGPAVLPLDICPCSENLFLFWVPEKVFLLFIIIIIIFFSVLFFFFFFPGCESDRLNTIFFFFFLNKKEKKKEKQIVSCGRNCSNF